MTEAKSVAALDHPYICKIYEIGEVNGRAFIAMEYIEGVTLEEKLYAGPLRVPHILELGVELAEALEAAHKKGIVHRDIKTSNIIVTPDGHVKILDFGVAKRVAMEALSSSQIETLFGPPHIEHRNAGHGHLYVTGTSTGRGLRRKNRHFLSRHRALRNGNGHHPVPGSDFRTHLRRDLEPRSSTTTSSQPQFARGSRAPHPEVSRKRQRPPVPDRQGLDGGAKTDEARYGYRYPDPAGRRSGESRDIREQDLASGRLPASLCFSPSVSGFSGRPRAPPSGTIRLPRRSPVREHPGRSRDRLPRGRYRRDPHQSSFTASSARRHGAQHRVPLPREKRRPSRRRA